MFWNKQGTSALLLTNTDVDKTGASYYGKQTLHYLDAKGETAMVMLSKYQVSYASIIYLVLTLNNCSLFN